MAVERNIPVQVLVLPLVRTPDFGSSVEPSSSGGVGESSALNYESSVPPR